MKQSDKELLFKDLCARLPYGVHLRTSRTDDAELLDVVRDLDNDEQYWINGYCDIEDIKPYLRPMSLMTELERKRYLNICNLHAGDAFSDPRYYGIDWLNENHFDYRGLIGKGLALEAPSGMYL